MRVLCLAVIFLFIAGCGNMYHEPSSNGQPIATVTGSNTRTGLFQWTDAMVKTIDDQSIGPVWSGTSKINILPGSHVFLVTGQFIRGFGDGPYISYLEVPARIQSGINYHFTIKPTGATVSAWLEDSAGNRVSSVISNSYTLTPRDNIITVYTGK
jgi:hypothetical protein